MKKHFRFLRIFAVTAILIAGPVSGCSTLPDEVAPLTYTGPKQNVVLMIGDGMGFNHIKAAEAFHGELFLTTAKADTEGEVTTYSLTPLRPTDSAAAATALATGSKTKNGQIGQYRGEAFQSATELAVSLQMATGIIVTEGVEGATPAGFSAHTSGRDNADEILADQLKSGINLFIGSNIERYRPLKNEIEKSYFFADSLASLDWSRDKIFASFEEIPLKEKGETKPTLAELCSAALDKLSENPNGFFLMIEESHIDKRSHENDLLGAVDHVKAYDNAIRTVTEKAAEIGNTIVIVTADHETGGLKYNGETKDQLSDKMYTKTSHSSANVPFFIYGETGTKIPAVIDNTQIGNLVKSILSAKK